MQFCVCFTKKNSNAIKKSSIIKLTKKIFSSADIRRFVKNVTNALPGKRIFGLIKKLT